MTAVGVPAPRTAAIARRGIGWAVVVAVLALSPIVGRAAPGVYNDYWAGLLTQACVYALAALSLNLLMGYAGQISLGHAAFLGVGGYTSGMIAGKLALPMIEGTALAAVAGAAFAFVVGLPALRIRGLYLAISTLGFSIMLQKMVFASHFIGGGSGGRAVPRPKVVDYVFKLNADYFVIAFIAIVAAWIIDRNVVRSRLGRALFALKSDERVASSFGVNVGRHKLIAFALSGALAGVAGSLFGHSLTILQSDTFSFDFSLVFVIMCVVGGLGSRAGVVTAAAAYALLPGLLHPLKGWIEIIGAALLVFTVARHPGGLAQAFAEAREKKGRGAEEEEDDLPATLPVLPGSAAERRLTSGDLLVVKDVAVRFGGLQALDGASLTVSAGTIAGLIGPNGAGKSTLFDVVSGFVKPERGEIEICGTRATTLPPHDRVALGLGRSFQMIGLVKDRSVLENFLVAQHLHAGYNLAQGLFATPRMRAREREMRESARQAVALLGFERFTDRPVSTLSHGQQRLVELGCLLVTSPHILLLDEPSSGMSPAAAEALADRLARIRDDLGRTVLLIEHHIPMVLATCDEVTVLNAGRVLAHGTTDEIVAHPDVVAAYLGEAVA